MRLAHYTIALVLLVALLSHPTNADAPVGANNNPPPVAEDEDERVDVHYSDGTIKQRSISKGATMMASCTGEYHLCKNFPRRSTGDIWTCLLELTDYIQNQRCYDFVTGFFVCQNDINSEDECATVMPEWSIGVHHCLRVKHPSTISDECKATRYYQYSRQGLGENETSKNLML